MCKGAVEVTARVDLQGRYVFFVICEHILGGDRGKRIRGGGPYSHPSAVVNLKRPVGIVVMALLSRCLEAGRREGNWCDRGHASSTYVNPAQLLVSMTGIELSITHADDATAMRALRMICARGRSR